MRVVIIDDEPIAREGVRTQLLREPEVEIVAECGDGLEAVEMIRELAPDLVFLDVQMPGMDGFEVVQTLGVEAMPAVVFVTAYDKYALQAFEVNAVDYLLKPFDGERFQKAFQRARLEIQRKTAETINEKLVALLESMRPQHRYLERLVVKSGGRIFFLPVSEIDWIESADNYVNLHSGRESHLIRETLTSLETKLNPEEFLRIRHSAIVNVTKIKELHPLFKGEYEIVLHNAVKLTSSRRYRQKLEMLLRY
ncbi:MAG TPA: LytTR family DNA-binding domain-containing protein [Pyrinomonadaceae bacterium]